MASGGTALELLDSFVGVPMGCDNFFTTRFFTAESGAAGEAGGTATSAGDAAAATEAEAAAAAGAAAGDAAAGAVGIFLTSIAAAPGSTESILRLTGLGLDGLGLTIVMDPAAAAGSDTAVLVRMGSADDGLGVVDVLVTLDECTSRNTEAGGKQVIGLGEEGTAMSAADEAAATTGVDAAGTGTFGAVTGGRDL